MGLSAVDDAARLLDEALARWAPSLSEAWNAEGPGPALDELLAHLIAHRGALAGWLGSIAWEAEGEGWPEAPHRWLSRATARWLLRKNQFLPLDDRTLGPLDALHRRALSEVAQALASAASDGELRPKLAAAAADHRLRLSGLLGAQLGPCPREVVASEYAPSTQLRVLGLSAAELRGPILDVGCGARAALVAWLREQGLDAHGIDRDAPEGLGTRADWLVYPFGSERWGAVLSHQGFSLHFLHHHLASGPAAALHAQAYMRILRSLRPGGLFAYAPALPFFEALLPPALYRCRRAPLPAELRTQALGAALAATGLPLDQATRVERIGSPT